MCFDNISWNIFEFIKIFLQFKFKDTKIYSL